MGLLADAAARGEDEFACPGTIRRVRWYLLREGVEGMGVRFGYTRFLWVLGLMLAAAALGQEGLTGSDQGAKQQSQKQGVTPENRAEATRRFLGLGAVPDKAAAERGKPVYEKTCAFCHGPQARGATGANLITSDEVLGDDHGEHLVPFLKKGRPEKGMPAFATMTDAQLKDIAEFLHLQVEDVANRGTYQVLNIVVGNAERGRRYVETGCAKCHAAVDLAHFAGKFRSPEQLQRGWIWPARGGHGDDARGDGLAITATVTMPNGVTVQGRVTQVSDFRITVVDASGAAHAIEIVPGVQVALNDPLAAHEAMIETLSNDEMHNVTAYLETLR
jgi:mono/diheme cytochrome c family protein